MRSAHQAVDHPQAVVFGLCTREKIKGWLSLSETLWGHDFIISLLLHTMWYNLLLDFLYELFGRKLNAQPVKLKEASLWWWTFGRGSYLWGILKLKSVFSFKTVYLVGTLFFYEWENNLHFHRTSFLSILFPLIGRMTGASEKLLRQFVVNVWVFL